MMFNFFSKRGMAVNAIVVIIIALFVLIIVGLGFYAYASWGSGFFNNLPNFNQSTQAGQQIQLFRYDLTNDNVQWYDGTQWNDFKSDSEGQDFGGKIIDEQDLKNDYQGYWFSINNRDNPVITFDSSDINKIFSNFLKNYPADRANIPTKMDLYVIGITIKSSTLKPSDYNHWYDYIKPWNWLASGFELGITKPININAGDIDATLLNSINKNDKSSHGLFVLKSNNELVFEDIDGTISDVTNQQGVFSEIKNKMIDWRDSILQGNSNAKAMTVHYKVKGANGVGSVSKTEMVCVKKYDNQYLDIDLTKPVSSDEGCK